MQQRYPGGGIAIVSKAGINVVCMLGMHRSGTSMIARLLNLAGVYLGPDEKMVSSLEGNPMGHWENTDILEINETLLARMGGTWDNPPALKSGWENDPALADIYDQAKQVVARDFKSSIIWGWKEPRTTILVPFWKKVVRNIKFVIIIRDLSAVAMSLKARDGIPINHGSGLWEKYMVRGIHDTEGDKRIFVFYEDFFADPISSTKRLLGFCGLPAPQDFTALINGAINPVLRRNRETIVDTIGNPNISERARILYLGLYGLCRARGLNESGDNDAWGEIEETSLNVKNLMLIHERLSLNTTRIPHGADSSSKQAVHSVDIEKDVDEWIGRLQGKIQNLERIIVEKDRQIAGLEGFLREKRSFIRQLASYIRSINDSSMRIARSMIRSVYLLVAKLTKFSGNDA